MFKRFFDSGNPLMQALAVAADLLILNVLTILCCIPILTAGAALSALNDVVQHIVRNEETYLIKSYFLSFRNNLLKGSLLGLIFLFAAALIYFDYIAAAAYAPPLRFAAAAVAVIALAIALYTFALQARYENTVGATLKNAATLTVAFFPRTLGMVVCTVALWAVAYRFLNYALPVLLMFGFSLPCYVCALLYNGIFEQLDKPDRASRPPAGEEISHTTEDEEDP